MELRGQVRSQMEFGNEGAAVYFPAGRRVVLLEGDDGPGVVAQQFLHDSGGLIAAAKPNHFERRPIEHGHFREIGILDSVVTR